MDAAHESCHSQGMPSRPRGPVNVRIPPGDTHPRQVCDSCGFIHYVNPRIVVGALCLWEEKILLCRRAIEPRLRLWTLPAGYLELHETTEEAARRETREEACAEIETQGLLAIYSLRHISQVQLIYLAHLVSPSIAPGPESAEVGLFSWEDLPREEIAFPSVHWALDRYAEVRGNEDFQPATNPHGETGKIHAEPPGMRD